jgi:hypothetical protein
MGFSRVPSAAARLRSDSLRPSRLPRDRPWRGYAGDSAPGQEAAEKEARPMMSNHMSLAVAFLGAALMALTLGAWLATVSAAL